jgi:hypothetical protein
MLATPALILWMAGAGCIFSCERGLARSEETSTQTASCPSHRAHDSSAARRPSTHRIHAAPNFREGALSLEVDPSTSVESCPLAINANAIASKMRSSEVAATNSQVLPPSVSTERLRSPQSRPVTLFDRKGTHLRCCVFLI